MKHRALATVLVLLPFALAAPTIAQDPADPAAVPAATDAGADPAGASATAAPAPGAGAAPTAFDPEAATRAYLDRVPPDQRARSDAYFEGGYWLQLWGFLYGLAVALLLLSTGLSRRLRDFAAGITRFRPIRNFIYGLGYILLATLLSLPLTLYQGFYREHKYDLSNQTLGEWLADLGKGVGVSVVLGSLVLVAIYAVLRHAPRTWWIWASIVVIVFLAV